MIIECPCAPKGVSAYKRHGRVLAEPSSEATLQAIDKSFSSGSTETTTTYRCMLCERRWLSRYQYDPGTGSDNYWALIEGPELEEV